MRMHPNTAIRLTRAAQGGVLLASLIAVVVFLLPEPEVEPASVEPASATVGQEEGSPADQQQIAENAFAASGDWTVVVPALESAMRTPAQDEEEEVVAEAEQSDSDRMEEEEQDEPRELPAPPGWRYIGHAELGGALSALVDLEGRQRFVDQGETIENYRIARITREFVLIRGEDRQHRLEREPSVETDLTGASPGGVSTPAQRREARRLEERRQQEERIRRLREQRERARRQQEEQADEQEQVDDQQGGDGR